MQLFETCRRKELKVGPEVGEGCGAAATIQPQAKALPSYRLLTSPTHTSPANANYARPEASPSNQKCQYCSTREREREEGEQNKRHKARRRAAGSFATVYWTLLTLGRFCSLLHSQCFTHPVTLTRCEFMFFFLYCTAKQDAALQRVGRCLSTW